MRVFLCFFAHLFASASSKKELDGGWRKASETVLANLMPKAGESVGIDTRVWDSVTEEEFNEHYRDIKPLLLTSPPGSKFLNRKPWQRENLLRSCSENPVLSGASHVVAYDSSGYVISTLEDFVDEMDHIEDKNGKGAEGHYIFDRRVFMAKNRKLRESVSLPRYLHHITKNFREEAKYGFGSCESKDNEPIGVSIGSSRSGTAFHNHGEAWNVVFYGKKRWLLYPPTAHFPILHSISHMAWIEHVMPTLAPADRPIEVVQGPGQLIYLPEAWHHSTVNMGQTISVFAQMDGNKFARTFEPPENHRREELDEVLQIVTGRIDSYEEPSWIALQVGAYNLRLNRGQLYHISAEDESKAGRFKEAAQFLEKSREDFLLAHQLKPRSFVAAKQVGMVAYTHVMVGQVDKGGDEEERAERKMQELPKIAFAIDMLHSVAKLYDGAKDADIACALGGLYSILEDIPSAKKSKTRCDKLTAKVNVRIKRIEGALNSRRYELALKHLEKAALGDINNGDSLYLRFMPDILKGLKEMNLHLWRRTHPGWNFPGEANKRKKRRRDEL